MRSGPRPRDGELAFLIARSVVVVDAPRRGETYRRRRDESDARRGRRRRHPALRARSGFVIERRVYVGARRRGGKTSSRDARVRLPVGERVGAIHRDAGRPRRDETVAQQNFAKNETIGERRCRRRRRRAEKPRAARARRRVCRPPGSRRRRRRLARPSPSMERRRLRPTPRFSGLCDDATWRDFDANAFGSNPNELLVTDPQQRATLRRAAREILLAADARFQSSPTSSKTPTPNTAVYVGASTRDYASLCVDAGLSAHPFFSTGCAFVSVIAGRVSFACHLSGACLAIDTACSSGLVCAHLSRVDVVSDRWCVAGVNALFDASTSAMFARAGMLTPDGRCKTLDVRRPTVRARQASPSSSLATRATDESASVRSSSPVVMTGTAVNQDGRSSSLTAPNGPSQTRVIRDAYAFGARRLDASRCTVRGRRSGTRSRSAHCARSSESVAISTHRHRRRAPCRYSRRRANARTRNRRRDYSVSPRRATRRRDDVRGASRTYAR